MENPAEETCCHPNQNFKIFWTIATCLSFVNSIIGTPAREVKSGRDFRPGRVAKPRQWGRSSVDYARVDGEPLRALFEKITGQPARIYGPSIVGHGSDRYTYESGRTGEAPLAAFAIRGRELVVYLSCEGEKQQSLLRQVGRHKMGKCCLYFKQLADLDPSVLEKLVVGSITETRRRYG